LKAKLSTSAVRPVRKRSLLIRKNTCEQSTSFLLQRWMPGNRPV